MNTFKQLNNAKYIEEGNKIIIDALPKSDFFVNPETMEISANAQFVYQEVSGDFIMKAKVSADFKDTYDASVLLAMDNQTAWAKACFELTDFDTKAVVTVMTNGVSDDANGINIVDDYIWLQLARKGDMFAIHYSIDGKNFIMARLTRIAMNQEVKVGMVGQSPIGTGGKRIFEDFSLAKITVNNIRLGR